MSEPHAWERGEVLSLLQLIATILMLPMKLFFMHKYVLIRGKPHMSEICYKIITLKQAVVPIHDTSLRLAAPIVKEIIHCDVGLQPVDEDEGGLTGMEAEAAELETGLAGVGGQF